ncbi:MAG: DUF1559 domain-containing protein [Planctomyces sp.]|nr:DUF1559 domain-containing protein [Planctomyces sp.]
MKKLSSYVKLTAFLIVVWLIVWVVAEIVERRVSTTRRANTKIDVELIMQAMHQYHDIHGQFPPAFVVGPDGQRWHSWRALLLPILDPELGRQYRLDEPWNGPHNSALLASAPAVFQSDCVQPQDGVTSYFAVVGRKTMWPADQSLSMRQICDGTSNTLVVVEDSRSDIRWLEPRDFVVGEFYESLYHGEPWNRGGGRTVGLADGTTRFLATDIRRDVIAGLLTPCLGTDMYRGANWPADLSEPPPEQKLREPVDIETLHQTQILAASSMKMNPEQNQLWAATFQMVWDQLKSDAGSPVILGTTNEVLDHLNSSSFDEASLSSATTLIARTGVSPSEDSALSAQLSDRFPGVSAPINTIERAPGQWGLRLYAMIRKSMPFESEFDRFQTPLNFSVGRSSSSDTVSPTVPVVSFGQDPEQSTDGDSTIPYGQVEVLDDLGDDNFIIQLNSTSDQQDAIVLGLIPPEQTLAATWDVVAGRIANPNPKHHRRILEGNETLQIPVLDFSLQKHFRELENQSIDGFSNPATLELAFMDIRLRLDETGAEFQSSAEAGVVGEFGEDEPPVYEPERIRRLIFNRSFFIAIKERKGTQPWFIAWIANNELMETPTPKL